MISPHPVQSRLLQFGRRTPGADHLDRPTAFGLVFQERKLACVRVTREGGDYYDLPGGARDGEESEQEALVREFLEETGMTVRPLDRITEAAQYFCRTDGEAINNIGGFWIAEQVAINPEDKVETDHELVWLHPHTALADLRHDAHAWAVTAWLRRQA